MYCAICKLNQIRANIAPYGGYLCKNRHIQCQKCNAKTSNKCILCSTNTDFVRVNATGATVEAENVDEVTATKNVYDINSADVMIVEDPNHKLLKEKPVLTVAEAETTSEPLARNSTKKPSNVVLSLFLIAYQAYYKPPTTPVEEVFHENPTPTPVEEVLHENPTQSDDSSTSYFEQFFKCSLLKNNVEKGMRSFSMRTIPHSELNIPLVPLRCPDTMCIRHVLTSDFTEHLIDDHNDLPKEKISRLQNKIFFLDTSISRRGISRCHNIYFMQDMADCDFKDCQPLVVMSTKIVLSDMYNVSDMVMGSKNMELLMIWITGIDPDVCPVRIYLKVYSHAGPSRVPHLVKSCQMYCLWNSSNHKDIFHSGSVLLLPMHLVNFLTNEQHDLLELHMMVQ